MTERYYSAADLREGLPTPPTRMLGRPIDHRGYPVPWFVTEKDEQDRWDFRIVAPERRRRAIVERLCWVCGDLLGRRLSFVIGPMCAVNRATSEPAVHRECGIWSAKACPFMLLPRAKRRDANLPEGIRNAPGIAIDRNPGVVLVWSTDSFHPFSAGNGYLLRIGPPTETLWFAEGREATREEILESINSGAPILEKVARDEGDEALAYFRQCVQTALELVPAS